MSVRSHIVPSPPYLLKLDQPFAELLWCQVEAVLLMCNVMVLAEDTCLDSAQFCITLGLADHTSQVTSTEEDAAAAIAARDTGLFCEVRSYGIDNHIRPNEACSSLFEAIDAAQTRAEIAFPQVSIGQRALLRFLYRREELIARYVFVKQIGSRD